MVCPNDCQIFIVEVLIKPWVIDQL